MRSLLTLLFLLVLTHETAVSQSVATPPVMVSDSRVAGAKSLANRGNGGVKALESERSHAAGPATALPSYLASVYKVGPGDVLDISINGVTSRESTLYTITEDGKLDYPLIGEAVTVAGLTTSEVANALKSRTRVFQDAPFLVNVRDYASHFVIVTGAVLNPGSTVLRREAVPLYVVLSDVEPLPKAETVSILRKGQSEQTFKLTDEAGLSTPVISGDLVRVMAAPAQPESYYYMGGSVKSPGQFPFHQGITLTQAVLASGGATNNDRKVKISRLGSERKLVSQVFQLDEIQAGKKQDPFLEPGDRIEIIR